MRVGQAEQEDAVWMQANSYEGYLCFQELQERDVMARFDHLIRMQAFAGQ
jgi:hypothetical protein